MDYVMFSVFEKLRILAEVTDHKLWHHELHYHGIVAKQAEEISAIYQREMKKTPSVREMATIRNDLECRTLAGRTYSLLRSARTVVRTGRLVFKTFEERAKNKV